LKKAIHDKEKKVLYQRFSVFNNIFDTFGGGPRGAGGGAVGGGLGKPNIKDFPQKSGFSYRFLI
jgi:hypothetical protein